MEWIGELYDIDARAEGDLDVLAELRRSDSVAVLEQMKAWLWSQAPLETLSIGKAAAYAIGDWNGSFASSRTRASRTLDNSATDRGVRGPVVGRRNHFGSKSRRGTEMASIISTLVETAKLAPLGEVLMPWQFAEA